MAGPLKSLACIAALVLVAGAVPGQEGDGSWLEIRKLLASDGGSLDVFGEAVAIDGDRLVVGARLHGANNPGAVYVFERHAGGPSRWEEVEQFLPEDPDTRAELGGTVSIHGDTVAAGALGDGDGAASAYVFDRLPDGSWSRTRLLPPDDPDTFGNSVATDGETVFVGSASDDDAGLNAGAVYVYDRDAGGTDNWGIAAKLTAADPNNQANLGLALAVEGGILVAGAPNDGGGGVSQSGAAHVFERDELGEWIEVAKLYASDADSGARFGEAVAVDGTTVVIAAENDSNPVNLGGAIYVFEPDLSGQWVEVAKLTSSDAGSADHLGVAVAIWADTIAGGAPDEDDPGGGSGAVYMFQRDAGGPGIWAEVAKLEASDTHDTQSFGGGVGISGGTLGVGAHGDDEQGFSAGAAYVFRWADLDLALGGSCPGEITVTVTGAAPRGPLALLGSDAEGSQVLPPGPCEGTELGLESPALLTLAPADEEGGLSLTRTVAAGSCGRFLQAVEVGICNPSNTAQVPGGS